MKLLEKKNEDNTYYEFDKILADGYRITEQPNLINKVQFANGRRKKITTTYTDVVIEIDLGCFDGDTLTEYIEELTDGEYSYYSLKDQSYKSANFVVTMPQQSVNNVASGVIVNDFTAILEKSSETGFVS